MTGSPDGHLDWPVGRGAGRRTGQGTQCTP